MKSIMLIALLCFGFGARAEDSIHSIVKGLEGEPHLVKFNSGAVTFVEHDDQEKLQAFENKFEASETATSNKMMPLLDEEYEPTLVPDNQIQAIFNRMNPYMRRKSECSDRAHVWAYDEFQKNNIKSQKAFLLLTDTYIKRTRFKWWFHVAPMYTTTSGQKIVMDFQFLDHPVTFAQWKNLLVFSKRDCVTDFRFMDYDAGADQTQDCYTKHEPMYYLIPGEIGNRERGASAKTSWNTFEVNAARSRAFLKGSK